MGALLKCLRANLHVVLDEEVQNVSDWAAADWMDISRGVLVTLLPSRPSRPPTINDLYLAVLPCR